MEEIDRLLDLAADIEHNLSKYAHACDGKRITTLFYKPGTRVRLSFESAMLGLDGSVLDFSSAASSLAAKGESMPDTTRVISCYVNICAMRHLKEDAPLAASTRSSIPVINVGDGGHQHPTRTLTDLTTIRFLQGRLDNMTVSFCGDLRSECIVYSPTNILVRYPGIKFVLISSPELRVLEYIREDILAASSIEFKEVGNLDEAIPKLDILYMTKVQKERFFSEEDYIRLRNCHTLGNTKMKLTKKKMFALHPLPHINGISVEVGGNPRAACFRQVQYGVYVHMAFTMTLLEMEKPYQILAD